MSASSLNLQKPRFEFKYVVDFKTAEWLMEQIQENLTEDSLGPGGYKVNSLYYDTEFHRSYFEKLDGVDPRYKLRIRWYGDIEDEKQLAEKSAYVEIKHRLDQRVYKDRVKVEGILPTILDNTPLQLNLSDTVPKKSLEKARIIESILNECRWLPKGVVRYFRRAYTYRMDPSLRITLDTSIVACGTSNLTNIHGKNGIPCIPPGNCVMEIKFHYAMPLWLLEVCREAGLSLRRYSKYCTAVERLYPKIARRELRLQEF